LFIFLVLNKIISGTLDADRLDYVSRDLFCSGVSKDIINYNRMFMFLSFEDDSHNEKNNFPLTISPKAVGDIEEFLRKRWKIYRDINFHHSVHKSEMLLRSILIKSAETSQKNRITENIKARNKELDLPVDFFQGILRVLRNLHEDADNEKIAETVLRLDDSWLDTSIKKIENKNEMVLDLIYGRKKYQTVIKRFDDFFELIDQKVYNLFKNCPEKDKKKFTAFDNKLDTLYNKLENKLDDIGFGIQSLRIMYLRDALFDVIETENTDHDSYVFLDNNFFISYVINCLNNYRQNTDPTSYHYLYRDEFLKRLEDEVCKKFPAIDGIPSVMLGGICFDQGIKDDLMVRGNNSLKLFKYYSGIENHLRAESLLLLPFHFYCKIGFNNNEVIEKLPEIIFEILKNDIIEYIKNFISETQRFLKTKEED